MDQEAKSEVSVASARAGLRIDPDDGSVQSHVELRNKYRSYYKESEIQEYWDSSCIEIVCDHAERLTCQKKIIDRLAHCGVAIQLAFVQYLLRQGHVDEAKQACWQIVHSSGGSADVFACLAFLHDICHETREVPGLALQALRFDGKHPHALLLLGMACTRHGDFEEASRAYTQVAEEDEGEVGRYAVQLLGNMNKNLSCRIQAVDTWKESAPWIAAQMLRMTTVDVDQTARLPIRHILEVDTAVVHDNVLAAELLQACLESVDDLCCYALRSPQLMNTFWWDSGDEPKTAAEVAGLVVLRHIIDQDLSAYRGVKWWCKNQPASMGAHFHYDCNFDLHRPAYAAVLYLADVGGPTIILDQYADKNHHAWPEVPQVGHLVMPRVNRCVVFPGELRHGMIAVDGETGPRLALLFNFFESFRVPAPHCQIPDFRNYEPLSKWSPTRRHLLKGATIKRLLQEETRRACERYRVAVKTLSDPEDMEWSSCFGDFPIAFPLPCVQMLHQGLGGAAVFKLLWRVASEKYQRFLH